MSLSELAALSRAYIGSNLANGQVVSGGMGWAHDVDLTNRNQSYGAEQNQKNRDFQGQMQQQQFGHEDTMQAAKFNQENIMQQSQFQHDLDMQQGSFSHDIEMQHNTFGQQEKMQNQQFGQQKEMSNLDFSHNMDLGKMNISGNLLNTALGGSIGAVTSVLKTGADMYMQHSNQQFQAEQNTRNFNNQIQTSGVSSPALNIAS